jgi:hypothetical protein
MMESKSLEMFWFQLKEWSKNQFGTREERGPGGPLMHLLEEIDEVVAECDKCYLAEIEGIEHGNHSGIRRRAWMNEKVLEEFVDCQHLLFDAVWRAGFTLEEFTDVLFKKLEKNKARKWGAKTANEPTKHISE